MKLQFWDENIEERKRKDGGFQSKRENRLDKWVGNLWEMWEERGFEFGGSQFQAWVRSFIVSTKRLGREGAEREKKIQKQEREKWTNEEKRERQHITLIEKSKGME